MLQWEEAPGIEHWWLLGPWHQRLHSIPRKIPIWFNWGWIQKWTCKSFLCESTYRLNKFKKGIFELFSIYSYQYQYHPPTLLASLMVSEGLFRWWAIKNQYWQNVHRSSINIWNNIQTIYITRNTETTLQELCEWEKFHHCAANLEQIYFNNYLLLSLSLSL